MSNEVDVLTNEATRFAERARVPNKDGIVCGDGGVSTTVMTTKGREVEVAGQAGDLGQDTATATAIAAYNKAHGIAFNPEELMSKVVRAYIDVYGKFQFHTSHHVHPPEKITDCGDMHGKISEEWASEYGVESKVTRSMVEKAQELARVDETGSVEEQTLGDREHQEKGVLVVEGNTHSLVHWLQKGDDSQMWFVLDPQRAHARRQKVLEKMGYVPDEVAEIMHVKAKQDLVTNKRLAKGKYVFGVNVDEVQPQVRLLGMVQPDGTIG